MPKEFLSLRDVRISSKSGHIVVMKANEPKVLPDEIHLEALTVGCVPTENLKTEAAPKEEAAPVSPEQAKAERRAAIVDAIHVLIAKNDKTDFTDAGNPKAAAVKEITGFDVNGLEVAQVFNSIPKE